jgi:hypothetical protein
LKQNNTKQSQTIPLQLLAISQGEQNNTMKKQTAVEWLIQNIVEDQTIKAKSMSEWTTIYEQAKVMEKEQMDKISEDWWVEGCAYMKDGKRIYESFEQYYNETYGGDK